MDFFDVVNTRYSYRGAFDNKKLTQEEINKILNSAIAAPIAMRVHSTSYIAITDEKIIKDLGNIINTNGTKTAPFLLVLLTEDKTSNTRGMNFISENYAAACENILLSVTALGYATVWTDGFLRNKIANDKIREILNVPSSKTIRAVLAIGNPLNPEMPKAKAKIEELVVFNKF